MYIVITKLLFCYYVLCYNVYDKSRLINQYFFPICFHTWILLYIFADARYVFVGTKNLATAELSVDVRYTHIRCIYERESKYKHKDPLDGSRKRTASSAFKGRGKVPFFLYQRVSLERQKHIEN